eukprot:1146721-Pelagomonas_calceolata.AAC.1
MVIWESKGQATGLDQAAIIQALLGKPSMMRPCRFPSQEVRPEDWTRQLQFQQALQDEAPTAAMDNLSITSSAPPTDERSSTVTSIHLCTVIGSLLALAALPDALLKMRMPLRDIPLPVSYGICLSPPFWALEFASRCTPHFSGLKMLPSSGLQLVLVRIAFAQAQGNLLAFQVDSRLLFNSMLEIHERGIDLHAVLAYHVLGKRTHVSALQLSLYPCTRRRVGVCLTHAVPVATCTAQSMARCCKLQVRSRMPVHRFSQTKKVSCITRLLSKQTIKPLEAERD